MMSVLRVVNYGPLREASISIDRPITVFAGPNGSGKTFVSRALYAMVKASGLSGEGRGDIISALLCDDLLAAKDDAARVVMRGADEASITFEHGGAEASLRIEKGVLEYGGGVPGLEVLFAPEGRRNFAFLGEMYHMALELLVEVGRSFQRIAMQVSSILGEGVAGPEVRAEDVLGALGFERLVRLTRGLVGVAPSVRRILANSLRATMMDLVLITLRQKLGKEVLTGEVEELFEKFLGTVWMPEGGFRDMRNNLEVSFNLAASGPIETTPIFLLINHALVVGGGYERVYVIIDEPEVHLEPPAQVKLAETLFELAEKHPKLSLVISTHSETFLLALTSHAARRELTDDIAVYEFKDRTAVRKEVAEGGEVEIEGFEWALERVTTI